MALIKCSECGHAVSNTAKNCPQCGASQAKQYGIKHLFIFLVVLGVIVSIFSGSENAKRTNQPAVTASAKPLLQITAADLYKEFANNEVAAQVKYKNTRIAITGEILDVTFDLLKRPVVRFMPMSYKYVDCRFPNEYTKTVANYKKGQSVTLSGVVDGMFITMVSMKDCKPYTNKQ
jgi:hypothetical protein